MTTATAEADGRFATTFAKSCGFDPPMADHAGLKAQKANMQETLETRGATANIKAKASHARVAQLDRASVYGTEGYRFDPCRA